MLGQWIHRPYRDLAVERMKEAHSRKARLRDLRGADRVICARSLAAALRVEPRVALTEADEVGFHAIGDSEIEMPPVSYLEEARCAEILVVAFALDIGPELARAVAGTPGSPGRYSPRSTIGGAKLKSNPNKVGSFAAWREQPTRALPGATRHGRGGSAAEPIRREPRRSQSPCDASPWRRTSRSRHMMRSGASLRAKRSNTVSVAGLRGR